MERGHVRSALAVTLLAALAGCQFLDGVSRPPSDPARVPLRGSEPTEEQKEVLAQADVAKEAGDYDVALALFREILAENPTIVPAYVGIGEIYMLKEEYERAEPAFRNAVRLEPRNYEAQYGHGLALHMLDRYEDAVRAFHRALLIDPQSVDANRSLATTYLSMNEPRSALRFAEKAVELEPGNAAARTNLGAIYELLGRSREAVDQYLAASELMTEPAPQLMLNLMNALSREKRYVEVIYTGESLLKIDVSANAYERVGHAHFRLKEYDKSMEAYRAAVQIDANHWQSLNGVGVNALNRWLVSKKRDAQAAAEARDAFRRSLQVNPSQPKVVQLLSNYQL
jgi:superkiller protein 3